MKKFISFLFFSLFALITFCQTATISWNYTVGAHNYNKSATLDMQYGRLDRGVVSPYKLALEKDGQYLTGAEALAELQKPIWGENANKPFSEILPVVDKVVPEFIQVSNWRVFPDEVPVFEEGVVYNLRVEIEPNKYKVFSNGEYSAYWWGILAPIEWKPVDEPSSRQEPNPAYPLYLEKVQSYEQALATTFTQMGTYIFPSFKVIDGCTWKIKYDGDAEWTYLPVDPNHYLASTTGGYIYKLLPVREFELRPWSVIVNSTILSSGDTRLKLLLGIR